MIPSIMKANVQIYLYLLYSLICNVVPEYDVIRLCNNEIRHAILIMAWHVVIMKKMIDIWKAANILLWFLSFYFQSLNNSSTAPRIGLARSIEISVSMYIAIREYIFFIHVRTWMKNICMVSGWTREKIIYQPLCCYDFIKSYMNFLNFFKMTFLKLKEQKKEMFSSEKSGKKEISFILAI